MSNNIIINFPTNFGDTVLALPILDRIRADYPEDTITVFASPRTKSFLMQNSFIDEVILFDKSWTLWQKIRFALNLRGKYDMIFDFKNSFLPVALGIKKHTPFFRGAVKKLHIKDSYFIISQKLFKKNSRVVRGDFELTVEEKNKWSNLNLAKSLFIACSSLSAPKRYPYEYLKKTVEVLTAKDISIIILGEKKDRDFYGDILKLEGVLDLVGKTTLTDTVYLLKNYGRLMLCVETGLLHLGSYLNVPTVAIFGPGDPRKAHPWSDRHIVLTSEFLKCAPCDINSCAINYECMKIDHNRVVKAIKELW